MPASTEYEKARYRQPFMSSEFLRPLRDLVASADFASGQVNAEQVKSLLSDCFAEIMSPHEKVINCGYLTNTGIRWPFARYYFFLTTDLRVWFVSIGWFDKIACSWCFVEDLVSTRSTRHSYFFIICTAVIIMLLDSDNVRIIAKVLRVMSEESVFDIIIMLFQIFAPAFIVIIITKTVSYYFFERPVLQLQPLGIRSPVITLADLFDNERAGQLLRSVADSRRSKQRLDDTDVIFSP
jgi:hypothetical protein